MLILCSNENEEHNIEELIHSEYIEYNTINKMNNNLHWNEGIQKFFEIVSETNVSIF